VSEICCASARSVVKLYLCSVWSGKRFKKSHTHALCGVCDLCTELQSQWGPVPAGAQGHSAHPV